MAPSCVHLFPGITGLLLRNAASSWFPAWLWKKRGHQHPHAHSSRERSFPLHLLCHTKAAERHKDSAPSAPREAQPSPRLYPAAEPNKWTKAEAFFPLCLTTISRAKKEAVSSPVLPLPCSLVPFRAVLQGQSSLHKKRFTLEQSLTQCTLLAHLPYIFGVSFKLRLLNFKIPKYLWSAGLQCCSLLS